MSTSNDLKAYSKPILFLKKVLTTTIFMFWAMLGVAQTHVPTYPVGSFSLQVDNSWLKTTFDDQIGSTVKLVGLGEITHGSIEVFQFKAKMIQYLVMEKGYRRILFEYPDAALFLLNRYLLDIHYQDPGILKFLVNKSFANSIRDRSFAEMFQWIKSFNQAHPNDPVSIAGVDIVGAAPSLITYFKTKFSLGPNAVAKLDTVSWQGQPVRAIAAKLLNYVHDQEADLKMVLGKEWQDFTYLVRNAELELAHDNLNKQNIYAAARFRDSVMAENVLELNRVKSIVWAHNLHCTSADLAVSMGNFLAKRIGDDYYTVLTDFADRADVTILGRYGIQNIRLKADKNTIANLFWRKYDRSNLVLFSKDLLTAGLVPNVGFIDRNGKYYFTGKGKTFDALISFKELSPAN